MEVLDSLVDIVKSSAFKNEVDGGQAMADRSSSRSCLAELGGATVAGSGYRLAVYQHGANELAHLRLHGVAARDTADFAEIFLEGRGGHEQDHCSAQISLEGTEG